MFTRSHRGMTIVEIVSATAILILILSISFAAIRSGQRTQAGVQSTISLTGDVLAGVRQLRKDLETTNLTSVSVFETPPSCSMATTSESQPISEFGTPAWNGHIYYTLEKSDKKVAKLIRWVLPESKPGGFPIPSKLNPWDIPGRAKPSVAIKNLLSTDWSIEMGKKEFEVVKKPSKGGFQVRFVRRATDGSRTLSTENPSTYEDNERFGWSNGNTELILVDLIVVRADRAPLSAVKFDLRVVPRN